MEFVEMFGMESKRDGVKFKTLYTLSNVFLFKSA